MNQLAFFAPSPTVQWTISTPLKSKNTVTLQNIACWSGSSLNSAQFWQSCLQHLKRNCKVTLKETNEPWDIPKYKIGWSTEGLADCPAVSLRFVQGGIFNCSFKFSVPKWKLMGSQSEILIHEILDVQKILVGWTKFFFLALKFGRKS